MEYGTQVLELLTEINETSAINVKSRCVCSLILLIRRSRRRKVHCLSLGCCVTTADMHAEPKFPPTPVYDICPPYLPRPSCVPAPQPLQLPPSDIASKPETSYKIVAVLGPKQQKGSGQVRCTTTLVATWWLLLHDAEPYGAAPEIEGDVKFLALYFRILAKEEGNARRCLWVRPSICIDNTGFCT